jgi:hypothetical protein
MTHEVLAKAGQQASEVDEAAHENAQRPAKLSYR